MNLFEKNGYKVYIDLKDPKCAQEYLSVIPCPKCKKNAEYDINEN